MAKTGFDRFYGQTAAYGTQPSAMPNPLTDSWPIVTGDGRFFLTHDGAHCYCRQRGSACLVATSGFPNDHEDVPAATLITATVDNDIALLLRSFANRPTVHMAVVLASSPDLVEAEYRNLKIVGVDGNAGEVTLAISHAVCRAVIVGGWHGWFIRSR